MNSCLDEVQIFPHLRSSLIAEVQPPAERICSDNEAAYTPRSAMSSGPGHHKGAATTRDRYVA